MPADDSALKYRALTEISEAFLGSRDCDALFRGLWDSLSKLIRFDYLLLALIDEQARSIRVEAMAGELPLDTSIGRSYPLEGGPSELAWKSQEPLYVPDFALETRFRPDLMSDEQLKHMALIVHHCYGSFDLALRCVMLLEQRQVLPAGAQRRYVEFLACQR
jgi:hypothetical protein